MTQFNSLQEVIDYEKQNNLYLAYQAQETGDEETYNAYMKDYDLINHYTDTAFLKTYSNHVSLYVNNVLLSMYNTEDYIFNF